jgi:hypothetical protein
MIGRLTFWLLSTFAKILGVGRDAGKPMPVCRHDFSSSDLEATGSEELVPTYVVTGRRWRRARQWTVNNCESDHPVATGLTQMQAETLCMVLNLACRPRVCASGDATHRKRR